MGQQPGRVRRPGRRVPRRTRRPAAQRLLGRTRRRARGALGRIRRRAARGALGRIPRAVLGPPGRSRRLRRWVLVVVLLAVVVAPYPSPGAAGGAASVCRSGCRSGSVPTMVRWTRPLPGSWDAVSGLTGTVPAAGLAYVSVGYGVAAVGVGLTVYGYSSKTGGLLWRRTLTGFPADAAIVSVRTWPGEVTAGVSYSSAGHPQRAEVVLSGSSAGARSGRYPAAEFGGAVAATSRYTVVIGPTAVTSYDNATGRIRWQRPIGPVPQAWRTDGGSLYVAESAGGLEGSAPVTELRRIDLATGAQIGVQPLEGLSFTGTFSAAFDGVVLFSSAGGVTAYYGSTGAWLWSLPGAVPEGADPQQQTIYLTRGSDLIGVNPLTGQVTATIPGSAVAGPGGIYVVRDGVALGLDQDAGGGAWGYEIGAQRVTLAAAGLGWPHYFVDLSGVGGSADPASGLVVIAACAQLAPGSAVSPTPSGTPAPAPTSSPVSAAQRASPSTPASASTTPSPGASPSASPAAGQRCLRPELVALNL